MKKMCIFLLTFCVSLTTAAQSQERATLLKGELTHGGFGGPEIRITELDGESNILIGGKGAWLIDRRFYLGGAGFGATKKIGNDELAQKRGHPQKRGQVLPFAFSQTTPKVESLGTQTYNTK